ncbi:RIO kinase 1 [Octopus vulgaris]|uniref:RIO kinase 1 n=2 Tax=Octopus vulgaris TaxID=6645 RepID=A0AA36AP76_OCTVU|nr:RIO kinase 1 [Octopus vulgaris]
MATAAPLSHQGRIVLIAALAGGLFFLGFIFSKKYFKNKTKLANEEKETMKKDCKIQKEGLKDGLDSNSLGDANSEKQLLEAINIKETSVKLQPAAANEFETSAPSFSQQSQDVENSVVSCQYDDTEETLKTVEHDINSDSSFDFFDLATSPNDFKPTFEFVHPAENLNRIKRSEKSDNINHISDVSENEEESTQVSSQEDITNALDSAINNTDTIGADELKTLVSLLLSKNVEIQEAAILGIVKCAAFTDHQNSLRELGCLEKLNVLLSSCVTSLKVGHNISPVLIASVANAISNMSVNENNQIMLKDSVPLLVDLILGDHIKENALLATLRALTNLSTTEKHHGHYTQLVENLYQLIDGDNISIKLQALKVLVNLSCSSEMVRHLLAAKAPQSTLALLHRDVEEALVLRWTTLLANIVHTVKEHKITQSSLPYTDKAASPETMYTALYGVNMIRDLKSEVFLLSKHKNEDIRYQAARIYSGLLK